MTPNDAGKRIVLWVTFAVLGVFAFWQCILTHQIWSIQHALLAHKTANGEAVVTRVARLNRRGGGCTIQIWAGIIDGNRRPVSIKAPGGLLSLIGPQMDWFDCRTLERPAEFAKMIAVGDHIQVVYAVDDPSLNRPAWVDYPVMMARIRLFH